MKYLHLSPWMTGKSHVFRTDADLVRIQSYFIEIFWKLALKRQMDSRSEARPGEEGVPDSSTGPGQGLGGDTTPWGYQALDQPHHSHRTHRTSPSSQHCQRWDCLPGTLTCDS